MIKRILTVVATIVALLAFSVTAMASPPEEGIELPQNNNVQPQAERPYNNPMDVPGFR